MSKEQTSHEDSQGRHFIKIKHKKKKIKKKPCIPYRSNNPKYGRTYPSLNLVFVDYNYNTVGGYGCNPAYGGGTHVGVHVNGDDYEEEQEEVNNVVHNSHGALINSNVGYSQPHGGPLGFFGQGGLFDFSGGSSGGSSFVRPQVDDPYGSNNIKPVIEINVPDTFQDAVGYTYMI